MLPNWLTYFIHVPLETFFICDEIPSVMTFFMRPAFLNQHIRTTKIKSWFSVNIFLYRASYTCINCFWICLRRQNQYLMKKNKVWNKIWLKIMHHGIGLPARASKMLKSPPSLRSIFFLNLYAYVFFHVFCWARTWLLAEHVRCYLRALLLFRVSNTVLWKPVHFLVETWQRRKLMTGTEYLIWITMFQSLDCSKITSFWNFNLYRCIEVGFQWA